MQASGISSLKKTAKGEKQALDDNGRYFDCLLDFHKIIMDIAHSN